VRGTTEHILKAYDHYRVHSATNTLFNLKNSLKFTLNTHKYHSYMFRSSTIIRELGSARKLNAIKELSPTYYDTTQSKNMYGENQWSYVFLQLHRAF